ncbi:class I SAM-dependent methyltransferase [Streptomyces sp. NPDC051569]|uniref:class I SAM-dependent methyltransferase n=1 Tax=Streptomyces sp. NPDC051569 TaxID=3365661 RepID=UPI00379E446E
MNSPSPRTPPDLWHGYGRTRAGTDRAVPDRLFWTWYQDSGPGAELLGELTGRVVADLGAGPGGQAAHIARDFCPARIDAIDSSPAQHGFGQDFYGHISRLRLVLDDTTDHLRSRPASYDVCYSLFGALDFTDPRRLLPAVATALKPGGTLVFSTLAHYRGGAPPESEVRAAAVPARLADGTGTTMSRWVLDAPVWEKLLTRYGFTGIVRETYGPTGDDERPPMTTHIYRAVTTAPVRA